MAFLDQKTASFGFTLVSFVVLCKFFCYHLEAPVNDNEFLGNSMIRVWKIFLLILTEILTEILINKTNYPVVLWLAHPEFGKETMLNNENTKRDRYIRVRSIWPHKSAI